MSAKNTHPVAALIFDMDGTLVDNMAHHNAAWEVLIRARGLPFVPDTFFAKSAGRANPEVIATFMPDVPQSDYAKLMVEKEQAYQDLYAPKRALMPGILNLLQTAMALGVPCAVGTAAPVMNIGFILDALDIRQYFQSVVHTTETIRGKPHPDIFLACAQHMGIEPAQCVVFEVPWAYKPPLRVVWQA